MALSVERYLFGVSTEFSHDLILIMAISFFHWVVEQDGHAFWCSSVLTICFGGFLA